MGRTFDRYGEAKLAADRASRPDVYPASGTATAAEVVSIPGPYRYDGDGVPRPSTRYALRPVKTGTAKAATIAEAAEARRDLRALLKPGARVYTVLRQVARSGMSRHISLQVVQRGAVRDITRLAARAMGDRLNKDGDALVVGGCGMDMGFHVVESLAATLYPDGFVCKATKCPGSHYNRGDTIKPGERHPYGGSALKQEWV